MMWDSLCHARKRVTQWAGQHQTLLVGTGVVVACGTGAYYMVHRVMSEAEKVTKDMQRQIIEQQRLNVHLRRTEDECKAAFLRFLPSMKVRIYKQLDLEGIVESLKMLDKNEKETRDLLWEDAKLIGFTRLYINVYAFCLLQNLLHCELLIMGRESFEKVKYKVEDPSDTDSTTSKDSIIAHHEFLSSTLDYFFATGLPKLIATVESHVNAHTALQSWRVHEKRDVERGEMNDMLDSLNLASTITKAQWQSFLIFPEDSVQHANTSIWINELRDILESPFFHSALLDSIDTLFQHVKSNLLTALFETSRPSLPLAKVIPQLKTEANKCFNTKSTAQSVSTTEEFWTELSKIDSLQHLAMSIFVQEDTAVS